MKKAIILTLLFNAINLSAQETKSNYIGFVDSFQFTFGFTNLVSNHSMMGEAHKASFPLFTARLGIFQINKLSVGLHASLHSMEVRNTNYYGYFTNTNAGTIGPYLSYYQEISESSLLEPYISYDFVHYKSNYEDKKLKSESDGLGLGIDYQHKISRKAYVTFGLKYSFNKMRTETHRNWEKYMNNYNFMTAKIGFTFSRNRL